MRVAGRNLWLRGMYHSNVEGQMTVNQIDLQQILHEFEGADHKVEFTKKGSTWDCCATYVGNIDEYKGSVTSGYGGTELAASRAALVKARANKPELWADRQ